MCVCVCSERQHHGVWRVQLCGRPRGCFHRAGPLHLPHAHRQLGVQLRKQPALGKRENRLLKIDISLLTPALVLPLATFFYSARSFWGFRGSLNGPQEHSCWPGRHSSHFGSRPQETGLSSDTSEARAWGLPPKVGVTADLHQMRVRHVSSRCKKYRTHMTDNTYKTHS